MSSSNFSCSVRDFLPASSPRAKALLTPSERPAHCVVGIVGIVGIAGIASFGVAGNVSVASLIDDGRLGARLLRLTIFDTLGGADRPMDAAEGTEATALETFSRMADMFTAVGLIALIEGGMAAVSRSAAAFAEARMLDTDIMLDMPSRDAVLGIADAAEESHPPPQPPHEELVLAAAAGAAFSAAGASPLTRSSIYVGVSVPWVFFSDSVLNIT